MAAASDHSLPSSVAPSVKANAAFREMQRGLPAQGSAIAPWAELELKTATRVWYARLDFGKIVFAQTAGK
jgi:hypothetical protein